MATAKTTTKPMQGELLPNAGPKKEQAVTAPRRKQAAKPETRAVSTTVKPAQPARAKPAKAADETMLSVIMKAVRDPAFDAQKLQIIMAEQRMLEDRQREAEFSRALLACQEVLPVIIKDSKGDKANYAKLEKVMQIVMPIVRQHGFTLSWSTDDSPIPDHYRVVCYLGHAPSGFTRRYQWDLKNDSVGLRGEPNKTSVQGFGSTMSYGQRYGVKMMFNLIMAGEDNDAAKYTAGPTEITAKQLAEIRAMMEAKNIDETGMIKWLQDSGRFPGLTTLEDLPHDYVGADNVRRQTFKALTEQLKKTPKA